MCFGISLFFHLPGCNEVFYFSGWGTKLYATPSTHTLRQEKIFTKHSHHLPYKCLIFGVSWRIFSLKFWVNFSRYQWSFQFTSYINYSLTTKNLENWTRHSLVLDALNLNDWWFIFVNSEGPPKSLSFLKQSKNSIFSRRFYESILYVDKWCASLGLWPENLL